MAHAGPQTVTKRERRMARERRNLRAFKHTLGYLHDPIEALSHTVGVTATWDAVRRIAAVLIHHEVRDIMLAWQIVFYVKNLPDGTERLKNATDAALAEWERECMISPIWR